MPPNLIDYRQRDPDPQLNHLADAYQSGLIDESMVRQALDRRKRSTADFKEVVAELESQIASAFD
jgi:hypothetical protein